MPSLRHVLQELRKLRDHMVPGTRAGELLEVWSVNGLDVV
jgi:hypothetical protein